MTRPYWLDIAKQEMGVTEVAGPGSNPRVMLYFAACGATWVKDDSTPWCGAGLGYVMKIAGIPLPKEPLRARSWADWGQPCKLVPGAIVVVERNGDPSLGHVGTLVAAEGDKVFLLGFNQNDTTSIEGFSKARIVEGGVRWPPGIPLPGSPDVAGPSAPKSETPAQPPSNGVLSRLRSVMARVAQIFGQSKTVFGGLVAMLGTLLQYLNEAAATLIAAAAEFAKFEAVTPLLAALGANTKSLGFGLAVFGITLTLWRRIEAGLKGKIG